MKQKILAHSLVALMFFGIAGTAYAVQAAEPTSMYTNPVFDRLRIKTIPCLLLALVDLIFLIAVPIIVMCIIYAGFLFVSAQGNETKITKARTVLIWTIIGAGVLLSAKGISLAIQDTVISVGASGSAGPACP